MRALIATMLVLIANLCHAQQDLDKAATALLSVYQDAEQTYNEAAARGRLIDGDLNAAKAKLDATVPSMENLLFQLKRQQEPSLDLRRQAAVALRNQEDVARYSHLVQELKGSIAPQVKEMCEQVEKWKKKGVGDEKRGALLEEARRLLDTVVLKVKKEHEAAEAAKKSQAKLLAYRAQVLGFNSIVERLGDQANGLVMPTEEARRTLSQVQKELAVIPLRVKTLNAVDRRATELFATIKAMSPDKDDLQKAEDTVKAIHLYAKEISDLNEKVQGLSNGVSSLLDKFDSLAKGFKESAAQIIAPFHSGLIESLDVAARNVDTQLAEASLAIESSLSDVEKLRACLGQIEYESDLSTAPDIRGLTYEQAVERIGEANLQPSKKSGEAPPERRLSGTVYEQTPAPGQKVLPGTPMFFRVYGTYAPIVPDLTGKGVEEAQAELSRLGLEALPREGEVAPDKSLERRIYLQSPRGFTPAAEGTTVEFQYYGGYPASAADEQFSTVPFFVLCRLYVPKLKPNAPAKPDLTIDNVVFVQREAPYVIAIRDRALDRYSTTFFEPNKAIATFIEIRGREGVTGLSSQYDGSLLLEVVDTFTNPEELKKRVAGLVDLSEEDPLAYISITEGSGLFSGTAVQSDVQLKWRGGPLVNGWSSRMKEGSFSLFRQLL